MYYRDKFFLNGDYEHERNKVARWYEWYGREIIHKYRNTEPLDAVYNKAPTFREFVEFLVDLPLAEYNFHWIPIYILCMPCHFKYSILARLDTLAMDSREIFKALNISASLHHNHVTQGNNMVASYYSTLSMELLGKLVNIYKFDFLLFNYSLHGYKSQGNMGE